VISGPMSMFDKLLDNVAGIDHILMVINVLLLLL